MMGSTSYHIRKFLGSVVRLGPNPASLIGLVSVHGGCLCDRWISADKRCKTVRYDILL